ncbi:unnamed protein product [Caenorhabditis sp. 36 PRJEB53466]|nr:unnamed protein product [Caenorhabditis sp. 36 PRJEB53466]
MNDDQWFIKDWGNTFDALGNVQEHHMINPDLGVLKNIFSTLVKFRIIVYGVMSDRSRTLIDDAIGVLLILTFNAPPLHFAPNFNFLVLPPSIPVLHPSASGSRNPPANRPTNK